MKHITTLLSVVLLLGAQSAWGGGGKGVPTTLVPEKPPAVKKAPPVQKCVTIKRTTVDISPGMFVGTPGVFAPAGCCCGGSGIFVSGSMVSVPTVATTIFSTEIVCEGVEK